MAEPPQTVEPVASAVQRVGVLLAAGVSPASSWRYLAESPRGPTTALFESVARRAADGESVAEGILDGLPLVPPDHRPAWRGIAAAWHVAAEAGAPLAPTLQGFASSLRALGQVQRDITTALAAPAATATMVGALPVVGILFGLALGFDSLRVLFTTPQGLACLLTGIVLMVVARVWNRRLVQRARPSSIVPGLALDLMAIAVSGGASIDRAREAVEAALDRCGLSGGSVEEVDEVLDLSARAGVPAAALLRSAADESRRSARSDGERRAATLSVTLMLPLGLCVLPSFMLLAVAPMLVAVISSTVLPG
jgi:tight adherence protein B